MKIKERLDAGRHGAVIHEIDLDQPSYSVAGQLHYFR